MTEKSSRKELNQKESQNVGGGYNYSYSRYSENGSAYENHDFQHDEIVNLCKQGCEFDFGDYGGSIKKVKYKGKFLTPKEIGDMARKGLDKISNDEPYCCG